ncbi:MAG: chromosome segregation SMC family protein, partial [Lachnospiraceae bacterium]
MYLKSIEMQGFKSFANRMCFEFRQGITGIVGPNGSGKSNVADAVRWVLGEQSAKQLRGGNMQDVIFAGTEARKPQSFASVAITFDNSDHALDIDFEEVTVTRRLYRSGESEYRINNAAVRLRDIQELFYDTGIGKEGYSIIGQGQIEKILSGKAEERRELFDEAAGIVKFKRRKNMSLKKLAEEQQNLLRVTDILRELSSQLEPLKKQSENAKVYLDKRETLKNLEVNVYLIETEKIRKELLELAEKIQITDSDMEAARKEFDEIRVEYDEVVQKIEALEKELSELASKMSQDQVLREQLRGQVGLYAEQIRAMQKASKERAARKEAIAADRLSRQEELSSCREDLGKLGEELQKSVIDIAAETEKLSAIDEKISEENAKVAAVREEIFRELDGRAKVQGEQQRFETMLEQIGIRRAEIDARLLRFKEEEGGAKEQEKQASEDLVKIREKISELAGRSTAAEQRVNALQNEIHTLDRALDADQVAFHREASRLESLKSLAEHYEGYGGGIQ